MRARDGICSTLADFRYDRQAMREFRSMPQRGAQSVKPSALLFHGGVGRLLFAGAPLLTTESLARGPDSVADVAEGLQDAVVNISTTQTLKGSAESTTERSRPEGLALRGILRRFLR